MIGKFLGSQFSGYLLIASIFIIAGMVYYIRSGGYKACLRDQITQAVKQENKRDEIEREVLRLNDNNLRKRYCKWMRDSEDECLQANIPIIERQDDQRDNAANHSAQ
jgi:hypothetical protein